MILERNTDILNNPDTHCRTASVLNSRLGTGLKEVLFKLISGKFNFKTFTVRIITHDSKKI
jgi:hypothetical protein